MKIGILGTFSSGKSSLIANLQSCIELQDYHFDMSAERGIARYCRRHGLSEMARQIQLTHHEAENLSKHHNYITDNPLHLVRVYTEFNASAEEKKTEEYRWLMQGYALHLNKYDLIFHLPLAFPMANARHRAQDKENNTFREQVDRRLQELLHQDDYYAKGRTVIYLKEATPEGYVEQFISAFNRASRIEEGCEQCKL